MWILRFFQFCWVLAFFFITWIFGYEIYSNHLSQEKLDWHIVEFLLIATVVMNFPVGILVIPIYKAVSSVLDGWIAWGYVSPQLIGALFVYCSCILLGWLQWFFIANRLIRIVKKKRARAVK